MSEAKLDLLWVPKEICPATFTIVALEPKTDAFKGRPYTFYVLTLEYKSGGMFQYEAKFGDKNFLINTLGAETDSWRGKQIGMRVAENGYKQLCAPFTS